MTDEPRLTLDDLRHRAENVRDLARAEVTHVVKEESTKAIAVGAIAVLVAISVAYYLGSRR
ncbi:MAG: hypothetical protein PF636_06275 [Actinomycetota bacterium]|jgi:hypothetical protein|nr:hypothetical protein [Actinomycetota bacterium]